jgi:hypothetical protein
MADIVSKVDSTISRGGAKLGGLTKGITKGIKSVTDPVQKLLGVKGELYTIGYIPWQPFDNDSFFGKAGNSLLSKGLGGGLMKAYNSALSTVNQIPGVNITAGSATQNGITIDGFFRFEGEMGVTLPTYPIQYRTDISMHRIRTPDTVAMEIFISSYGKDDVISNAVKEIMNNDLVSLLTGVSGDTARIRRKLNEFRWLMQTGKPFTLYTPHCVYENMVLTKIRPKNDEQTMDGWSGVLEFKEVIYYTDANDSKSRLTKKGLSKAGDSVINSFKELL